MPYSRHHFCISKLPVLVESLKLCPQLCRTYQFMVAVGVSFLSQYIILNTLKCLSCDGCRLGIPFNLLLYHLYQRVDTLTCFRACYDKTATNISLMTKSFEFISGKSLGTNIGTCSN